MRASVNAAFAYYFACQVKNQVHARLRRLRRPKYLFSALAGLVYLYATSFRFLFHGRPRRAAPVFPEAGLLELFEIVGGAGLLAIALLPWVLPVGLRGLSFKEAEIQFLFPAPLGRRALLHFRMLKGQLGILFGVAISAIFLASGRLVPHPSFLVADLWIVYTFLGLYNMGSALSRTSLAEHGIEGVKRQIWVLGVLAAVAAAAVAWVRWYIPAPPRFAEPEDLGRWIGAVVASGPAQRMS